MYYSRGDLLFFCQSQKSRQQESKLEQEKGDVEFRHAITASVLNCYQNVFHVGLVVNAQEIIHATKKGIHIQSFKDAMADLKPAVVELCHVTLDQYWKNRSVLWALEQVGNEYNDIFSPECINARGNRAFYCCQLIVESYKITSGQGRSPFLPHTLNFCDLSGRILPYWVHYYRQLSLQPMQGYLGSHPSKLRASSIVRLAASLCLLF